MSEDVPCFHYFAGRGKGEIVRLMLVAAEIEWTEAPYLTKKEEIEALRSEGKLLFQQVPLLEWNGKLMVQSGATARHIARKYYLDGRNEDEKLLVDTLTEGARDFTFPFVTFGFNPDEKEEDKARQIRTTGVKRYMPVFETQLAESTSGYLVGESLTMADVAVFEALLNVQERMADVFDVYPNCKAFLYRMCSMDKFARYLSSSKRTPPSTKEYFIIVKQVLGW